MNIDNMTLGQLKEIQSAVGGAGKLRTVPPLVEKGKKVFIRSVTHYYTGECVECNRDWLELKDAAWIADCGRFNAFLKSGSAGEVEPFENNVRIPIGCVIDVTEWTHALPRTVK